MVNYQQYIPASLLTTAGDMLIEDATPKAARLPAGSAGQVLGISGGLPAWLPGFDLQAATPVAGFALQNGTPNIVTWTTPNDGAQHRVLVFAVLHVTSPETGGQVSVTVTLPDGTISAKTLFSATQAAGVFWPISFSYPQQQLIGPNSTVTVAQSSALTGGASLLWAELWGS